MAGATLITPPRPDPVASVLAVDDQPVFLRAVRKLIDATAGMILVGEAGGGEEAVELVQTLRPDLVLMDICMPGIGGLEAARAIKSAHPATIVALLSTIHPAELECEACSGAADALILKSELRPNVLEELWERQRPLPGAA
jgi:two-component system, NarL family, invasion response regulator UvrY